MAESKYEKNRVCCNCGHNIRSGNPEDIKCNCDVDGHTIGYVECFETWCRNWKRDRKWDKPKEDT